MLFQRDFYIVNEKTINKRVSCQHLSCFVSSYLIFLNFFLAVSLSESELPEVV